MKCYYEELGIERNAEDAEIKVAYRKLALRWHPDKNPDCQEAAKERFQFIQQAYEVLNDQQERAFYDKHREQILRGKNSEYQDKTLDVFQYFTNSCYKGYEGEKGFYSVYREVFNKIAAEDADFMDDQEELESIPIFGDSNSSYEEVVGPFYAFWQSYCTKKSYTWLCPYDIQEIKDRRVLRAIEKEMKKTTQNAKRERNEEVRSLVSFVRKRDRRVQAYNKQLEQRAELNRKKQEQNRREQLLKRRQELEEMKSHNRQVFDEGYEEKLKELEQHYGQDSDENVLTDDEEYLDGEEWEEEIVHYEEFFCIVCTKAFKNQNAYDNHALSKKHRENEERLKLEMLEEEEAFKHKNKDGEEESKLKSNENDDSVDVLENKNKSNNEKDDNSERRSLKNKKQKQTNGSYSKEHENEIVEEYEDENDFEEDDEDEKEICSLEECDVPDKQPKSERTRKNKKNKKSRKVISNIIANSEDEEIKIEEYNSNSVGESDCENDIAMSKATSSRKNKKIKKNRKNISTINEFSNEENIFLRTASEESSAEDWTCGMKKSNRRNQIKKQTKNKTENQGEIKNVPKLSAEKESNLEETVHSCATCRAIFESKNKLFAHLKKTNHSVYIPKANIPVVQKKSKAKRK